MRQYYWSRCWPWRYKVVLLVLILLVGGCVSYRVGRPDPRVGMVFDFDSAELVDQVVALVAGVFVVLYSFLFGLVWQRRRVNQKFGWSRPWKAGKSLENLNFEALEAYRLYTTEAWFERHESKYMGEGTMVDAETW